MANKNKQKRRLEKSLSRRKKERLARAWRNIFVDAGVLKEEKPR
ncbi:DUF3983 domain-containing protein [Cytobacillus oceanisediminis]|nr:DUF3983 domain-containing protein [Cytobacillus oceanisediminis]USK46328.1 DUF3983 domain-containing protein [Cytobacillus oceanisediminis]